VGVIQLKATRYTPVMTGNGIRDLADARARDHTTRPPHQGKGAVK
jgi:hypothetical protein